MVASSSDLVVEFFQQIPFLAGFTHLNLSECQAFFI
jgi:hypothetical protein